jgi:hypothetical protein
MTNKEKKTKKNSKEMNGNEEVESNVIDHLFSWVSPERIWEPKSKVWYLSYAAFFMLLILIFAKLGYIIIILGILAFMFLWFVQGTIPPYVIEHRITSKGIITNSALTQWEELSQFWFAKKGKWYVLHLDFPTEAKKPRLSLLLKQSETETVFPLVFKYVKYASSDSASYNLLARSIYGVYLPVDMFLPDLDKPRY